MTPKNKGLFDEKEFWRILRKLNEHGYALPIEMDEEIFDFITASIKAEIKVEIKKFAEEVRPDYIGTADGEVEIVKFCERIDRALEDRGIT